MSDAAALDLKEQIARIDRAQEETRKFAEEQHKLAAKARKLNAEAEKIARDRYLAPWVGFAAVAGATAGALGGIAGLVSLFLGLRGVR